MPFWSGETLEVRLADLIEPFDKNAIDCAAYTLRIGHEIYVSPDREVSEPSRHTKQKLTDGQSFTIPPGQFGFLSTAERIKVPDKALAFISIKARPKFSGLINISGFHVDPGYEGVLLFSVLNAGPKPMHLEQGQPLFLIWYADLDRVTEKKKKRADGFDGIESKLINGISGEILSLQSLSDNQRTLEQDISRQLEAQKSQISNLRLLLNIFLTVATAIVGGLVVWALTEWFGAPPTPPGS